jgi:1-aminocyclopropane-1-carboxylate deaminase/D-cysteine desulfhydrase-like pyridoxal-dependent ACC family enzyme
VRGEKPALLSHTLQQCIADGMQLKFISRESYAEKETPVFLQEIKNEFGDGIIIPEGGYGNTGASGASLIWQLVPQHRYTHVCTATGTATTLAGMLQGAAGETIIGVPVLKNMTDIEERIAFCCRSNYKKHQFQIFDGYHFGGYAKKTPELLAFMNALWVQHELPTDFVYTAKLFFAIYDKIKNDYFKPGSNILCLHTGGLQGNFSLQKGSLLF